LAIGLTGCGRKDESSKAGNAPGGAANAPAGQDAAAPANQGGAAPAAAGGAAAQPAGGAKQASGWGSAPDSKAAPAPAPPPPRQFTLAAGTAVKIRTNTALSTTTAQNGQKFDGILAEALVVDGHTVARKGAAVTGEVAQSDPGGKVKGVASLTLTLQSLETNDAGVVPIRTGHVTRQAASSKKKDALKIGIGSAIGAGIGAIAGGGKGAAIGAGVGAAGGTGVVMATRGDPAVIASESLLSFSLSEALTVTGKQ
jgi:hypothetical protein